MIRLGERFSRLVIKQGFGDAAGFYGISAECAEQIEVARQRGLWTAVEQMIAPRLVVEELLAHEAERFPEWEGRPVIDPYAILFAAREQAEWAAADVVICPSEFVRSTIEASGGPVDKCVVVPYGVDASFRVPGRQVSKGPLKVLTVGAVGLRKGSPYVLEAARRMRGQANFRLVGPLPAAAGPQRALAEALDLRGQVPRAEIREHFAWADVFLLPSICEGSAVVIYEALAAGLPVVTTPNAGSTVRHGIDGFIIPVGSVDAIVNALDALDRDREMLAEMGHSARKAEANDINSYAERLIATIENVEARKGIGPTVERVPLPGRRQLPHESDVVGAQAP
jgi:glycosyltransferase involved in cell wall biosynthesis